MCSLGIPAKRLAELVGRHPVRHRRQHVGNPRGPKSQLLRDDRRPSNRYTVRATGSRIDQRNAPASFGVNRRHDVPVEFNVVDRVVMSGVLRISFGRPFTGHIGPAAQSGQRAATHECTRSGMISCDGSPDTSTTRCRDRPGRRCSAPHRRVARQFGRTGGTWDRRTVASLIRWLGALQSVRPRLGRDFTLGPSP